VIDTIFADVAKQVGRPFDREWMRIGKLRFDVLWDLPLRTLHARVEPTRERGGPRRHVRACKRCPRLEIREMGAQLFRICLGDRVELRADVDDAKRFHDRPVMVVNTCCPKYSTKRGGHKPCSVGGMNAPRKRQMLLVAVATVAGAESAAACTNAVHTTGFYGDIAYDGGYEDGGSLTFDGPPGAAETGTDASTDGGAEASAPDDASDDGG
jgi:hypothetical protein